jgi:xylulose-5-phosphate/fructose-6-phosphate phosphoketolase
LTDVKKNPEQLAILEKMDAFAKAGRTVRREWQADRRTERTGANRYPADEREPARKWRSPQAKSAPARLREYSVQVDRPAQTEAENTRPLGAFLRDVMKLNMRRFRVFGPDETTSNKLQDIYEASKKFWIAESFPEDATAANSLPTGG